MADPVEIPAHPTSPGRPDTWADAIDPLCQRLEVAAKFGQSFTFNSVGCAAHAEYIRAMAARLDLAVDIIARMKAAALGAKQ
ncbi:MAG: hypothetical protein ACK5SX_15175 [Sandaracinobacter sp.]